MTVFKNGRRRCTLADLPAEGGLMWHVELYQQFDSVHLAARRPPLLGAGEGALARVASGYARSE